ncbi:MAG: flippase [Balneolaceae bacterium]|nr:flippase [Balneolaceae bacterium]
MNRKGLLAKNSLINLLGQGVPLVFIFAAYPFIVDGLGEDRTGTLQIIWMIIGYFGLLDMGLGRATTKFVADMQARDEQNLSPFILTSILMLFVVGLLGCGLIYWLTPWLVYEVMNTPEMLQAETQRAFYTLSFAIPLVLGSVGARGALEAQQRFGLVNIIKIPAGILNYLAPLLVLPFSTDLQYVVVVLVTGRGLTFLIYSWFCLSGGESLFQLGSYPLIGWIKNLFSYGAWITVSNLISPIMVYMDRFIVAAVIGTTAVLYYATPYDVVTRLLIIPGSFMGVMFPAFSVASLEENSRPMDPLYRKSIRYLLLALVPAVVGLVLAAEPIFYYWLGGEFPARSTLVMQLLAVGVLINAIAMVPYTALQGMGRPDVTAKLHMVELPLFLVMVWFFIHRWGIEGVALAWVIRVALDAGGLLWFYRRLTPEREPDEVNWSARLATSLGCAAVMGAGYFAISHRLLLMAFAAACAAGVFWLIWTYVLHDYERNKIFRLYIDVKQSLKRR